MRTAVFLLITAALAALPARLTAQEAVAGQVQARVPTILHLEVSSEAPGQSGNGTRTAVLQVRANRAWRLVVTSEGSVAGAWWRVDGDVAGPVTPASGEKFRPGASPVEAARGEPCRDAVIRIETGGGRAAPALAYTLVPA